MRKSFKVFLMLLGLCSLTLSSCSKVGRKLSYYSDKPILKPVIFEEGTLSEPEVKEYSLHFSKDGKVIYIQKQKKGQKEYWIYESHFNGRNWSKPVLSSFSPNEIFSEDGPFISPDEGTFFFASNREGSIGKFDIWSAKKSGMGWGTPYSLGAVINSEYNEFLPSVAASGNLYFESDRPSRYGDDRKQNIYVSRFVNGKYTPAELLGNEINTAGVHDESPFIAKDESYLIFARNKKNTAGQWFGELYISYYKEGAWTDAQEIP
ncbi:PD40 domain-containing protein, partial [Xanthovirga aplysinae]|uniref:PD40 domain-containing protein n=1 Tax=Xanthovirga aplysinae TaxID=2529853 RepID=UPI0016574A1B